MVNISEPTYAGQVPLTFIAHGCYFYANNIIAGGGEDEAAAAPGKAARRIDVTLSKVTSAGTTVVATNKDVPRGECNGTRWRTTFTAAASGGNDHYQITVTKYDTDNSTETAEVSPFYVMAGVEQTAPELCLCTETVGGVPPPPPMPRRVGGGALVGIAAATADGESCCGCGAPRRMYPARYNGFNHYRPDMKHAVCVVFDPTPGPFSRGTVSVTPAEFSMGFCAAFVPVPADAGAVAYAYRFLVLDETKTVVLHQSNQKALA